MSLQRTILPMIFGPCLCALLACQISAQEARFSPEQLREDAAFIRKEVVEQHPDLDHSVDAEEFSKALDKLEKNLNEPMTRDDAWKAFATLNPILADGHLFIGIPNWRAEAEAHLEGGGKLFPFEVQVTDDGSILVKSGLGGAETSYAGAQLKSIDGVDARDVRAELMARAHGDTPAFRSELVSRRWWFYYWKVYGAKKSHDIVFSGGQPTVVRVPGSRMKPDFLAEESDFGRQFNLELLPCRRALLTVKSFAWEDKAQFLAFTRDTFARMRDAGVRTLVIDIRANGGGDDDYWIEGILPYITTKSYRWGSAYSKRVLEEYRDEGETAGEVVSGAIDRWIEPGSGNPLRFSGQVYVLIGRSTYSSAILFSNVVQDFGFGVVAGTGGSARANQTGGVQKSVLPNTGLVLWWPRFILARPSSARDPLYVTPDVEVAESPLSPRDAVDRLLARDANGCAVANAE